LIIDHLETQRIHLPVTFSAVFLPTNLSPLPVLPRDGVQGGAGGEVFDDFVRAGDVRKVLLGGGGEAPVEGISSVDLDSFAGRADVPCPSVARWTDSPQVTLPVPEPRRVHPAFEALAPMRRATPPVPQELMDCEASFGGVKLSDRWWVIGMGLAAAAILFSGAAVDYISREAVRRSGLAAEPEIQVIRSLPAERGQSEDRRPEEIAATLRPDEKR
jgi:hypothetical protein